MPLCVSHKAQIPNVSASKSITYPQLPQETFAAPLSSLRSASLGSTSAPTYAASANRHLLSPQATHRMIAFECIHSSRTWRCSELRGIRSTPLLRLPVCLAGSLHVPIEGDPISGHVPSVVCCDQVGVIPLTLRHLCPRSLQLGHSLARVLQEPNGFRFVPRLLSGEILPALAARFIHRSCYAT